MRFKVDTNGRGGRGGGRRRNGFRSNLNLWLVLSLVLFLVLIFLVEESSAKKLREKSSKGGKGSSRLNKSSSSGRTFNKRGKSSGRGNLGTSESIISSAKHPVFQRPIETTPNTLEVAGQQVTGQGEIITAAAIQTTESYVKNETGGEGKSETKGKKGSKGTKRKGSNNINKEKKNKGGRDPLVVGQGPLDPLVGQGQTNNRESYGLNISPPVDPGIQDSSWIGIDKVGVDQVERGGVSGIAGVYSDDGLDLDFSKVYVNPSQYKSAITSTSSATTPSSSVELGTLTPEDGLGKIDILERRVAQLEEMMQTVTRNIEVMQQNTQVISKGFNILSGRVNKVSADHEQIHAHMGEGYKVIEDKVQQMFKNMTKSMTEFEIKSNQEMEILKKNDVELLESQVTNGQNCHTSFESLSTQVMEWRTHSDNETKILAEMVKALAEISKSEKVKLENLTEVSQQEIKKLDETIKKCQVEDANNEEAFATKIRALRTEFQESNKSLIESSEMLKSGLTSLTQHVTEQVKRIDEAILEQNMAHNMAHENIAMKLEELDKISKLVGGNEINFDLEDEEGFTTTLIPSTTTSTTTTAPSTTSAAAFQSVPSSAVSVSDFKNVLKRLENSEVNISTLFNANRQFLGQVAALEDNDVSISRKISELRNVHKDDNSTTRKDIYTMNEKVNIIEEDCQMLKVKVDGLQRRLVGTDRSIEIGGMSMTEPTSPSLRLSEGEQTNDVDLSEFKDRFGTIEENVGELWRSQKELKSQHESFGGLMKEMQNNHVKMQEESSLQIMEVKIATKMLTEVVRNTTKNLIEIEKKIEHFPTVFGMTGRASGPNKNEIDSLKDEMRTTQENIANLWDSSKNVSKAQEFFLFKLLEMDLEHKSDNKTVRQRLEAFSNRTDDFMIQMLRADERINKVVQQFEITDAEQMKMREELLNIKDRLATSEENHKNLWKFNKQMEGELDLVANNVDNIILIHKTEHKNISGELAENKEKVGNLTKNVQNLNDRVSNIELVMDMEVSGESNSSELTKLKSRLQNSEKDISELWKSTEIFSFQQQVLSENLKNIQTIHENETSFARLERMKTKFEALNLLDLFSNLTDRVKNVEKCTSPPYESKTVDLEIHDWRASLAGGLKDQAVVYELGKLLDIPSSWKAFVEVNGNHLSIFNTLIRAEAPLFNEFQAEVLDIDGKTFASYGPDLHLYKANNEKIGWTNVISLPSLENPQNRLLKDDILRLRFRVKVYPKFEAEEPEGEGPSEKQLIQWEVRDLLEKVNSQQMHDYDAFLDLNVTKEFGAGHYWGGHTLWRSSLLVREINHQNYLGLNMELVDNDGNWKELYASYNVTLLDSHSRIAKEFSIASNDFKSVSARHSYFMLVKDLEDVLKRGDLITIRIYFDLRAKRRSFDVEIIR